MGGLQNHPAHVDNRPTIYQQIESLKAEVSDLKRCLKASNTEIDKLREDIRAQNEAIVNFVRMCSAPAVPAVPAASAPAKPKKEEVSYTPSQAKQTLKDAGITVYPGEIQSYLVRGGWAKLAGTNISATPKGEKAGMVTPRRGTKYANITEKGVSALKEHFAEVNR